MSIVKTGSMSAAEHKIRPFLKDVEPFFYKKPVIYVDIGAYSGAVFREIFQSPLKPIRAYLVEPNPASYARLKETVEGLEAERVATCYNLALGEQAGVLRLRAQDTMTRVLAEGDDVAPGEADFEIPARTLDALAAEFVAPHVSLLKIDVEGHEAEVLAGAAGLLATQAIDMIYIEAGLDPASRQQTYYRAIEDRLRAHGYRLFRIYEQHHEWATDLPVLRRVNLAFISGRFAEGNPLRLSKDLHALRRDHDELQRALAERDKALGERDRALEAARAEAAAAGAALRQAEERDRAATEAAAERDRALEAARAEAAAAGAALRQAEERAAARDKAAAEAAAERDRAAAEAAALEADRADQRRALEEAERRGAAAARRLAELKRELDGLTAYGRALEARHLAMLESETWRVMEPARRTIRYLTGKRPPVPFAPRLVDRPGLPAAAAPAAGRPAAPVRAATPPPAAPPPDKLSESAARKAAAGLVTLAAKRDYPGLLAKETQFARSERHDPFFFLGRFSRLLALKRLSAFTAAAEVQDAVAARLGDRHDWLAGFFGPEIYLRFVIDASTALARVGRLDDARRLMDAAAARTGAPPALLQHRAEALWPYDPEAARADLAAAAAEGALGSPYVLLDAYLEMQASGAEAAPEAFGARIGMHPQMALVAAEAARARGDFGVYRDWLNGYFAAQGLSAPLPPDADRFAFDALAAPGARSGLRDGPLVSVVMTTFDSAATVNWAVRSLAAQTHGALEILIVDDCSADGTRDRLAALAAEDPRVRILLNTENLGTYVSKNRAIAEAKGDYVTLHDSDDWAHPERIARHVAMMEAAPSLAAARSEWLRLDEGGALHFRRWGAKFQHPNPASTFLRRQAIDKVGYFDSVRYGADSEYWFRLGRAFPSQTKSLPLALGLGSVREGSLTQSGTGAMDLENYAPVRGAYAAAYLDWHATARSAALKLPPRLRARPFPAPPEMVVPPPAGAAGAAAVGPEATAAGTPEFMFGISLASARVSGDWGRTQELLGHTLRSLLNQSDPRFVVAICGHERPDLPELDDPRVTFLESDQGPPKSASGFRGDKMRKRRLLGAALRARGGGYFFPLDADDLVHRDVVAHARAKDNRKGYLIDKGYALDYANHVLAPIPGAWSVSFDRGCGSSAAIWFEPEELPVDGENDPELYFNLFQSHAYWPIVAEEYDRRLDPFPFAGGVYVVNHAQNLSFRLQRKGVRVENIVRAIAAHRVDNAEEILGENFGQPLK